MLALYANTPSRPLPMNAPFQAVYQPYLEILEVDIAMMNCFMHLYPVFPYLFPSFDRSNQVVPTF